MPITGNKGEWSEVYVLLFLAGLGRLYAADANVRKIADIFFPVLKIFRKDGPARQYEYRLPNDGTVAIYMNNRLVQNFSQVEFREEAKKLLEAVAQGRNSFSIQSTEAFMHKIGCTRLTAPAQDKTDISLQLRDINTGFSPICGFSIKSELGDPPTLINASGATNFIFSLSNISSTLAQKINSCSSAHKIKERIRMLKDNGISLQFERVSSNIFSGNLCLIDSRFEEILACILKYHYFEDCIFCSDAVKKLEETDPLGFKRPGIYTYKFKKFLYAAALGMTPATQWNGLEDANGGYIIVTSDGNVLAYYLYNKNAFEEYLLNNTKFERASTKRHKYSTVYKDGNRFFLNLNLQIRFIH